MSIDMLIRRLTGRRRTLASDERGSMLPVMAAVLLMATAGGALAVDITRAYSVRGELQVAADSAALAAALKLPDEDAAREAGQRYVSRNLPDYPNVLRDEDFDFGAWNATARAIEGESGGATAVRVTVKLAESRGNGLATLFAGVFGVSVTDVEASAVAGKQGVTCMLALASSGKGMELNGKAVVDLIGCGAQSNSVDKESLKIGGDVRMTTGGICVSGQAKIDKKADVAPAPIEYCPQHQDPMSGFIAPSIGGCTDNDVEYMDQDITLTPGRVFCDGLKIAGSSVVTLQPGLYVVDNGKFEVKDDAVLEGEGVTILLYGEKAEFDIKNSARLRLSAPTAGSLQGLLIVQDLGFPWGEDHDVSTKENKWDSDAISELTGVIYLPEGKFTSIVETNITGTDACFVLIASEIKIDGDANLSIDLTGSGCRKSLPTSFSRSVALLD